LRQLRLHEGPGFEEAALKLTRLGLTLNQAKVYVALLRLGGGKASEVAREAGVERAETYRALAKLERMGLVRASPSKPMKFIPSPPEEGVAKLLEAYLDRLKRMRREAEEAVRVLKEVERKPLQQAVMIELVVGRRRAIRKALEMIRRAKVEVDCVTSAYGLKRALKGGIAEAFEEAVKRGVKVKVLSEVFGDNLAEARLFSQIAEFKHSSHLNAFLLIVDDEEALVGVTVKEDTSLDTEDHMELWTNSGFFVKAMRQFFYKAWSEAEELRL